MHFNNRWISFEAHNMSLPQSIKKVFLNLTWAAAASDLIVVFAFSEPPPWSWAFMIRLFLSKISSAPSSWAAWWMRCDAALKARQLCSQAPRITARRPTHPTQQQVPLAAMPTARAARRAVRLQRAKKKRRTNETLGLLTALVVALLSQ